MNTKEKLRLWFSEHGKIIETSTGVWCRGYLNDIHEMIEAEVEAAYLRGRKTLQRQNQREKKK